MPVPSGLTAPAVAGARVTSEESERLQTRANPDWWYVHYGEDSANWFVGDIRPGPGVPDEEVGTWWLPKLQQEPAQPGINLHRTISKGERTNAAYDQAHLAIQRAGGTVLPKSLGYCVKVDCIDPRTQAEGTYHLEAWASPRQYRRGRKLKFDFDRQRYHRWLLHLMLDGHIAAPMRDVVSELLARRAARLGRRETQTDLPPEKQASLLAEAKAALETAESAEIPAREEPRAPAKIARKNATKK